MILYLHKTFKKRYNRLHPRLQKKIDHTITTFMNNHHDPVLRNHALHGSMEGKRALSVSGDMRIIFSEYNGYVTVMMLDDGTHGQVYDN